MNKPNYSKAFILAWRARTPIRPTFDNTTKWNYNSFDNWNKAHKRFFELLDNSNIEVKWIKSQPSTGDSFSIIVPNF